MILIEKNSTGSMKIYELDGIKYLKSYNVFVATKSYREVTLDEKYWDYSNTTARHVGKFFNSNTKEIRKMIKDGIIKLVNLN